MNQIVNTFLLAGDKCMPEMHLKQPGCTYSACGPFTRNKQRIQKFMQTGDTNYIYKNELNKACFSCLWQIQRLRKKEHNQIKS